MTDVQNVPAEQSGSGGSADIGVAAPGHTPEANAAASATRNVSQIPPFAPGDPAETIEDKVAKEIALREQEGRDMVVAVERQTTDVAPTPAVNDGIDHGVVADAHVVEVPVADVQAPVGVQAPPVY